MDTVLTRGGTYPDSYTGLARVSWRMIPPLRFIGRGWLFYRLAVAPRVGDSSFTFKGARGP